MKIAIGADHRGFSHKSYIIQHMPDVVWKDVGCFTPERCDYPEFAKAVVSLIQEKKVDAGVLLCGSGIGMSIAANRFKGIYAGLVWNEEIAQHARRSDNINIIVLPSDFVSPEQSVSIIAAWLETAFLGGRYQKRLDMIDTF